MSYDVFVRNWWRMERGVRVPAPRARKHYLARAVSYDEAMSMCKSYNASHNPGKLSRKAEFTER